MPSKINFIDKVLSRIDRLDRNSVQSYISELVQERKRFGQILDQINEGVILIDREGTVKYANRRSFLWLGFERIFKDRSQIISLVEDPSIKQFLSLCLKDPNTTTSDEFQVLTPREMTLRLHWIPLETSDQMGILVRVVNVSVERSRNEEEALIQRTEDLIRLAAGVAHEIGNPLNSIQIHIELLKQELSRLPQSKQKSFLKLIEVLSSETKRLDQTVRSFLRATRRPPLRFRRESLNEVLEEAVEFLRLEIERQKIRLRLELDRRIPSFLLDRDRIRQAFMNLIKNAIDAMPKGGKMTISTIFKEKLCLVQFEDSGKGIDEKDLPHIFEAYFTTKQEGSGLGLVQVYQTVREHGGRIDVKSQPEKGSKFTLMLPIRQERLSLPQPQNKEGAS